ncbi:hypothetical protein Tco_1138688 [Tanacetum coccineum]
MVSRLLQSHEYKQSLSKPFNMAIQAGWRRGLSEGRTEEQILVALHVAEGFDAYSDKKLYPMYDKLFEKYSAAPVTLTALGGPPSLDNRA